MPVSSLLERMRKKLQEKAASTGANATKSSAGGEGTGTANGAKDGASTGEGSGLSSSTMSSHRTEQLVPLPPPVFASPSSARLDYRDVVGDPLCVPFTADMAGPVAERVLLQLRMAQGKPKHPLTQEEGGAELRTTSSPAAPQVPSPLASADFLPGISAVMDNAARYVCEQLTCVSADTAKAATLSIQAVPSPRSLFEDGAYCEACALSRVDVSGAVRPVCRDVNYYTRVGRISQGVYGVVFKAVATDDLRADAALGSSVNASSSSPPSSAPQKAYALKHIKKMWLEESQVGFPPYLLREIDLLLRLKHPNVMGARELVLLGPVPLPQPPHGSEAAVNPHRRPREEGEGEESGGGGGFDDASPPHHYPKKDAQPASASSSANGVATSTAAVRPLAAVGAVSETKDVFLVMDFCPFDLTTYMRRYHTTPTHQIPLFHITPRNAHPAASATYVARAKSIAYQLFRAVAFMHANRVMHRDLKTSNVLLDSNGYVKVCDFGLGRLYREGQNLTPTVVTLMYRAPELHLGVVDYSHKMDVWSLGCILAELFLRRPLFHAATDSHHLLAVCDVIGIPTEESFPGLYHLPQTKVMMQSLPRWNRASRLAELFQPGATMSTASHGEVAVATEATLLPAEGLDLLRSILQWNPRRRPSAEEVLRHPFFHSEPLPCAPAELMRPMPWKDAEASSATSQRPPPSSTPLPAVAEVNTTSDGTGGGASSLAGPPVQAYDAAQLATADSTRAMESARQAAAAAGGQVGESGEEEGEREVRLAQLNANHDSDDAEDAP